MSSYFMNFYIFMNRQSNYFQQSLSQIMYSCWKYEPKGRPSFDEIHQAVKDIYIEFYADNPRLSSISSTGSARS